MTLQNKQPLYQVLYNSFKEQIESGRLIEGAKLPSIRQMTRDSAVSRTTVESAFEQLCADGYVICKPQSGYYVNKVSYRNKVIKEDVLTEELPQDDYEFDFSGKKMDSKNFDFDIWRRLSRAVMQESEPFLGYGSPQGELKLRTQISKYLSAGRGVYCRSSNIVIGAGVQSLLHILCEIIDKEFTITAFEDPGFRKGFKIFKDHHCNTVFVKGSRTGIDIDSLYKSGANILYISPSHSFPSGATLPHSKRIQLLKWARDVDGLIIEDDYDGELRYTGKPLATLTSLDCEGSVIYLGTFSKLLPPSIRISYMVLPDSLLDKYKEIAWLYNQTSSTMEQLTMARFIEDGRLEKQVRRLRRIYSRKNEIITKAFKEYFGNSVEIIPNDTGLHVIASIKLGEDAVSLCERARKNGIRIVPMSNYSLDKTGEETAEIYMSCASIEEKDIYIAVERLKNLWVYK